MMKRSSTSSYEAAMRRLERRKARNRLNALNSTGPRTEAGKQRSGQNARTHGFTALKAPLATKGMDEEAFCSLILGSHSEASETSGTCLELVLLAKTLFALQTRLNAIQHKKVKIYEELNHPTSILALASSFTTNPFISGKRQARHLIGVFRGNASTSTEERRLGKVSRVLRNIGKNLPNQIGLLKNLSRYERETQAQFRKIARRIDVLKIKIAEQASPSIFQGLSTKPKAEPLP